MTSVRFAMISLLDYDARDANAAGQYDAPVFEAMNGRLEMTIEPKMLNVVNAALRVLETSPLALPQGPAPQTPEQITHEKSSSDAEGGDARINTGRTECPSDTTRPRLDVGH